MYAWKLKLYICNLHIVNTCICIWNTLRMKVWTDLRGCNHLHVHVHCQLVHHSNCFNWYPDGHDGRVPSRSGEHEKCFQTCNHSLSWHKKDNTTSWGCLVNNPNSWNLSCLRNLSTDQIRNFRSEGGDRVFVATCTL